MRVKAETTENMNKLAAAASHVEYPRPRFRLSFNYGLKRHGSGPDQSYETRRFVIHAV